ncbi:MAG TPA: hypothetical protein PKA27_00055 [Fimbriimonadaceae bacterium]|nr:hypothetical protein [Fimbriimonadaceae bacterium]
MFLLMFWAQAIGSLVVWLGVALLFRRWVEPMRAKLRAVTRPKLIILGAVAMLTGPAVLFGGLFAASSGLHPTHMEVWAWVLITALGAAFVALQGLGAAIIAQLVFGQVTDSPPSTSIIQEDS